VQSANSCEGGCSLNGAQGTLHLEAFGASLDLRVYLQYSYIYYVSSCIHEQK